MQESFKIDRLVIRDTLSSIRTEDTQMYSSLWYKLDKVKSLVEARLNENETR